MKMLIMLAVLFSVNANAQFGGHRPTGGGIFDSTSALTPREHVRGHIRSDGTQVDPYVRTKADHNPNNNFGSPGNYNPNRRNSW
jgi:hypothetical protein